MLNSVLLIAHRYVVGHTQSGDMVKGVARRGFGTTDRPVRSSSGSAHIAAPRLGHQFRERRVGAELGVFAYENVLSIAKRDNRRARLVEDARQPDQAIPESEASSSASAGTLQAAAGPLRLTVRCSGRHWRG